MNATEADIVVITANDRMQRNGEAPYAFRQDSYFWYVCGLELPGAILLLSKKEHAVILPYQDKFSVIEFGRYDAQKMQQISGADKVYDHHAGQKVLREALQTAKKVGIVPPGQRERNTTKNAARSLLKQRLKRLNTKATFIDVRPELLGQRMVKQPAEIKAIERAVDITCQAFLQLRDRLHQQTFTHEYELEAFLLARMRQQGAQQAYTPIVAGGGRSCMIHYQANNAKLNPKDLVLIDMGAEYSNYASDITRTISLTAPSERQKAVIDAVKDVQNFAYSLLRPGRDRREYELAVEGYMGKTLRHLGLISEITRENIRHYYPHATTHHMGLDVHDVADYSTPFAEGMVLTVEPGIYIPEEGIGVRIEDDVLITSSGYRVLSEQLPSLLN